MIYYRHLGQNTKSNVVHCPFNTSHTMPQKTLLLHLTKCPDKKPYQSICTFNNLHVVHSSLIKVCKKTIIIIFKLVRLYLNAN